MLGLLKPKAAPEILAAAGAAIFGLSGMMSGAAGGVGLKALRRSPQAPIRTV